MNSGDSTDSSFVGIRVASFVLYIVYAYVLYMYMRVYIYVDVRAQLWQAKNAPCRSVWIQ